MCPACNGIEQHRRGVKGHAALEQVDEPRRGPTPIGQAKITITEFRCKTCGTKWEYENDKNDDHVGWSVIA